MKLTVLEKAEIIWGILKMGDDLSWNDKDTNQYIFNKGYKTGIQDTKRPGMYKVTVFHNGPTLESTFFDDIFFDDLQEAIDFAKSEEGENGKYCELFETFLDRDMDFLLR